MTALLREIGSSNECCGQSNRGKQPKLTGFFANDSVGAALKLS